jgi:hypothetical protein
MCTASPCRMNAMVKIDPVRPQNNGADAHAGLARANCLTVREFETH